MGSVSIGGAAVSIDLILFLASSTGGALAIIWAAAPHRQRTAFLLLKIVMLGLVAARASYIYLHDERDAFSLWTALDVGDGGFHVFAGFAATAMATACYAWRDGATRHSLVLAVTSGFFIWGGGLNVFWLLRADQMALPKITLRTLDNRPAAVDDFIGTPIVVNLWASWCPPCRREMPLLASAQRRHPDTVFLFPNQGEPAQLVKHYLQTLMPEIRNVLLDPAGQFSIHVGSQALPLTLFFSDRGILLRKHVGELSEAELEQAIAELKTAPGSR